MLYERQTVSPVRVEMFHHLLHGYMIFMIYLLVNWWSFLMNWFFPASASRPTLRSWLRQWGCSRPACLNMIKQVFKFCTYMFNVEVYFSSAWALLSEWVLMFNNSVFILYCFCSHYVNSTLAIQNSKLCYVPIIL